MSHGFEELDVLIWLPGELQPVLAGQVLADGASTSFVYDRSYLAQPRSISIFGADLPLGVHRHYPSRSHVLAPCLRDALPDRWGRRAIAASLGSPGGTQVRDDDLDEITVMLRSGADRIGALDFQRPGQDPVIDTGEQDTLEDLMALADQIEEGRAITPVFRHLIPKCSSVGGARPKALYTDSKMGQKYVAKFSTEADTYPVVAGEFVAMRLAKLAGLAVAPVKIVKVGWREVLLVERFDRVRHADGSWLRRAMVSFLTLTRESELSAHHISYCQLSEIIADQFHDPVRDQEEMLRRLVFNVLVGNSDDHARNHAAFWNGRSLELTPAYDIAPQRRTSREAGQAMVLANGSRAAQLRNVAGIAPAFGVDREGFRRILDHLVGTIIAEWTGVCEEAGLTRNERDAFAGRQFFNAYAFEDFGPVPSLS